MPDDPVWLLLRERRWISGNASDLSPLLSHTTSQPHSRTAAQWHSRTVAQRHNRTAPQPHSHTTSQLHSYTAVQPDSHAVAQPHSPTFTQPHCCTSLQLHSCTVAQPHSCTATVNLQWTNKLIHSTITDSNPPRSPLVIDGFDLLRDESNVRINPFRRKSKKILDRSKKNCFERKIFFLGLYAVG